MKTNGLRGIIFKGILLILLCLYFLLVFARTNEHSPMLTRHSSYEWVKQVSDKIDTPLPRLLSFEGISSNKQVKLNWKFETTEGLDECILERADKSGEFKPVAYFFMTEDIHIPDLKFTDKVPNSKTYQYRLRMTGKDGDKQFTKTLSFDFHSKEDQKKSLSYPLVAN
ncbi:MAG TPA: hypothetical protein VGI82_12405 [Chitinophagaceae bacterium]